MTSDTKIRDEVLAELPAGYEKPDDLLGEGGILEQLTKALVERVQGERARTFRLRHWLYSGQEMRRMLQEAGFSRVELYGNLEGDEYGVEARRLVAVARRA